MAKVSTTNVYILIGLLMLSATMPTDCASVYLRSLSRPERNTIDTDAPNTNCGEGITCGWAIYRPFTRVIDSFVKNSCNCAENQQCIRTDDNLSASTYEYKCKIKKS